MLKQQAATLLYLMGVFFQQTRIKPLLAFLTLLLIASCNENVTEKPNNNMIWIKHNEVKVGILPERGGRVVHLSLMEKENILKSDTSLWHEPADKRPALESNTPFKAYNGHIVWLGPQTDWWVQQDVDTAKRNRADVWPPDPYLIYGEYTVVNQTDSSVIMQGPVSPYSGVQLTKEVSIDSTGRIRFLVTAKNIRQKTVKWDLWLNTRLDGYASCFVPLSDTSMLREDATEQEEKDKPIYNVEEGFFTLDPMAPANNKKMRVGKYYIYPEKNFMAAFDNEQLLLFSFSLPEKETIHPEQAVVEIYNFTSHEKDDALLEMEIHGPYTTIQPGETLSAGLTWQLIHTEGSMSKEEKMQMLKEYDR